ncbi:hypothetical protein GCM10010233_57720 [Streptomyces pseudogriseolus]|nr:hypothetical protein GCM10010233_57720 [Streptomyces gancidicus]
MGVVAVARRAKGMSTPSVGYGSAVPKVTRGVVCPVQGGAVLRSSPRPWGVEGLRGAVRAALWGLGAQFPAPLGGVVHPQARDVPRCGGWARRSPRPLRGGPLPGVGRAARSSPRPLGVL